LSPVNGWTKSPKPKTKTKEKTSNPKNYYKKPISSCWNASKTKKNMKMKNSNVRKFVKNIKYSNKINNNKSMISSKDYKDKANIKSIYKNN
jgi:hypothetical protein